MEEEKVVAIEIPSDQFASVGSPTSSESEQQNSGGNNVESELGFHVIETEYTCLETSARSYIYYFFWIILSDALITIYCILTNIFATAICLFTGSVVCVLIIILRLAASSFLDENRTYQVRSREVQRLIRRLRRTRNIRVLRELMLRVLNLPRIEVDFMNGEDFSDRGLSQEVINQLPIYKYKSPVKDHEDKESSTVEKSEKEEEGTRTLCSICMDGYKDEEDIMILPCLHQFHSECIQKWLNESRDCPICKNEVRIEMDSLMDP